MATSKRTFFGFLLTGLLFLVLYFLLAWYNRPAADDFYFLHAVRTKGILDMSWTAYTTWITRWTALPFTGAILSCTGQNFIWFHAITLAVLVVVVYVLLQQIARRSNMLAGKGILLLYALLFVFAFFQFTISTGETWFWVTSACMYLWPLIAFLAGAILLTKEGIAATIACVLCFLFIGGGSEVVALEVAAILGFALWMSRKPGNNFVSKPLLYTALATLLISLAIAWLGPGRAIRQEALPHLSIGQQAWSSLQFAGYFLLVQLPLKVHWIFFLTLPWIVLRQSQPLPAPTPVTVVFSRVFRLAMLFFVCVVLHFILVTALLKSYPPARTSLTLSFALAACCAVAGWNLGSFRWSPVMLRILSASFVLATSIFLVYAIVTESNSASAYARAVDERMFILKKWSLDEPPVLSPLPPSGMLYSAEISSDTTHFTNRQLRDYLEVKMTPRRNEE